MAYIRVKYPKNRYDYIADFMLEALIESNQIEQFFRPSEERWVTIGVDPIRKKREDYQGPERRKSKQYTLTLN